VKTIKVSWTLCLVNMDYVADGKGVDEPNVLPSGDDLVQSYSKTWIRTKRRAQRRGDPERRGSCQVPGIFNVAIELKGSPTVVNPPHPVSLRSC
jgi:hypothetical protein